MTDLFSFEGVSVAIDGTTVLADVDAHIPAGKLTVLAGVSGSGKTSLLRLCNRLDVPTSGSIRFRGRELLDLDPLRLRQQVGMVFQRPILFGGTVRDNLLVANKDASETTMADALAGVDLAPNLLDRTGDDLSGGEGQRVCMARALLCAPQVLLMDEPTASLHPAAIRSLEATVQTLQSDRSVDVVWVTHDLEQIERMAEYLVVLRDGTVIFSGDPAAAGADQALATLEDEDF